jgi:uncharacterized protein involved in outer membrane biogenesis
MKKILLFAAIGLGVVLVLGVLLVTLFLDSGIKRGIERVGPMLTRTEVKLDSVTLSLLSGSGTIKGFVLGNPEGFKTPSAIRVGTATLALQPGSVFKDKVVIQSINLRSPEITFETDLKGNNLSKIVANLQAATGGNSTTKPATNAPITAEPGAGKKLQVDDFLISGGKINVSVTALGQRSATVPLPEIHLTGLGTGPEGITAAELTKRVLTEIEKIALPAATAAVADLNKQAADLRRQAEKSASEAIGNTTKGLSNLFKKK